MKHGARSTGIEDVAGSFAVDDEDVAVTTTVRTGEIADCVAVEKELSETIDTIDLAIGTIQREMEGWCLGADEMCDQFRSSFQYCVCTSSEQISWLCDAGQIVP